MSKKHVYVTISKRRARKHSVRVYDRQLSIVFTVGVYPLDVVVEPLQLICDAFVDFELALSERSVSCKAGCAACCNQLIPLSGVEVIYLQKVVAGMPKRIRRRVYAAFESRRKRAGQVIRTAAGRPDSTNDILNSGWPVRLSKRVNAVYTPNRRWPAVNIMWKVRPIFANYLTLHLT